MKVEEKRRNRRVQVRWPVSALTADGSIHGETKNISSQGAFISCNKPLRSKEACLLSLRTPSEIIQVNAQVVWSNTGSYDDERGPNGVGVRFIWF
jgi:hypothetical protein